MPKRIDIAGERYGSLIVMQEAGLTTYGGRRQSLWQCRCDCGAVLTLPTMKLPCTEGEIKAAARAGRYLYTACESCRAKTCPLCLSRFPVSHPSHICPDPLCQEELRALRDAFWHEVAAQRYKDDPEYRESVRAYQRQHHAENNARVNEVRREYFASLSPKQQEAIKARAARQRARWYAGVKADPERYTARLAQGRRRLSEQALLGLLADAQTLMDLKEKNNA